MRSMAIVLGVLIAVTAGCGDDRPTAAGPVDDGGRSLYVQHCEDCHGRTLTGTGNGPSFLDKVYEPAHHPDNAFRAAVANGARQHHWHFGPMPPVTGLTADEVNQIIAYIRARQREVGIN